MTEPFNNWAKLAEALPKVTSQVVRKTAFDVLAGWQSRVRVDTGFEKNSGYVKTKTESTYGGAAPTSPGAYLLPEIEAPADDQTAYIGVGANYGLVEELGGAHHTANPAMAQSVEAARPGFDAGMAAVEQAMKEAAR